MFHSDPTSVQHVCFARVLTSALPSLSHLFPLCACFDEVSTESDIDVYIIAVNCILPLPLIQADPHFVAQRQLQHHALTLHDGVVAGLGVNDGLLFVALHDVQVRLLEVPRVNVDIEEVDPWDAAHEFPLEHVEVVVQVDEHRVKPQSLVRL